MDKMDEKMECHRDLESVKKTSSGHSRSEKYSTQN